jgi:TonB family protein
MKWLPVEPELVTNLPVVGQAHPLRFQYRRFLNLSVAMAACLHLAAVSGWLIRRDTEPVLPRLDPIKFRTFDVGVPPSLLPKEEVNPLMEIKRQVSPPPIGIPDPVEDHLAMNETIAGISEISGSLDPVDPSLLAAGEDGGILIVPEAKPAGGLAPDVFVAAEQMPVLISIPSPIYPEIARQAEVQGTVVVRVLVGIDGKVRDAAVTEGIPMLNDAALQAARNAIFKPALQQHRPVAVWVHIPMEFVLN